MSHSDPSEKELRCYGLMMTGALSCFVALFLYKAWNTAAIALTV